MEGQGLRDRFDELEHLGVKVLGASFDTIDDNRVFAEAHDFPYLLLSDVAKETGRQYQVMRDPGESNEGLPLRISYLIDPSGIIQRSYLVKEPADHASKVIEDMEALTT